MASELSEKDHADLVESIAYILRYSLEGRPLPKGQRWPDPQQAARRVVEQILRSNWELRRLPPLKPHSIG